MTASSLRPSDPPTVGTVAETSHRRVLHEMELSVVSDLGSIEEEWRQFERHADCTAFQSFDWLTAWQRHIGTLRGTLPAVIVGRQGGETALILPLAITRSGGLRQLTFLGRDLGDYNAPLLAFDFARRCGNFLSVWSDAQTLLARDPRYRHDVVLFDKMPSRVGRQDNPMLALAANTHPSGAYRTQLSADWESFYAAKRSSSTRRRDRSKRKKLAEFGAVRLDNPQTREQALRMAETLIAQKEAAFARMGVTNIFARPGYRGFFLDIASGERTRGFAHVSGLMVGDTVAATNLGLCFRGTYYHVLASYDDGPVSRFGPGAAHLHDLMQYAIACDCTVFDFTIGDEPYKRDWCDEEMTLYDHVSGAGLRGHAIAGAVNAARGAKRAIKQSPVLWPVVLKVRTMVAALRKGTPSVE